MRNQVLFSVLVVSLFAFQTPVLGHSERETTFPDGHGVVPEYRPFDPDAPYLVVCKADSAARIAAFPPGPVRTFNEHLLPECAYAHIQAAVDAVTTAGTNIYVLPGVYHEEPSLAGPTGHCATVAAKKKPLSYEDQYACPALENLIAVFGHDPASAADPNAPCTTEPLCRLQIEGTGLHPEDVTIDAQWHKLNGIRADRADGIYIRNLLTERTDFNGIYVLETDGFVLEKVVGRFNYEYGLLTFAVDHGLIFDCETYLNGDSGIYPGSAADLHGVDPHPAVEIHHCDSHHNALGYSGTAGNSVYAHHNRFHHNSAGVSMDSFFPGHPGLPQDSSLFEHNWIYANNVNYYDNYYGYNGKEEVCKKRLHERDVEDGFVCPVVPVPVGTGILVAGGNDNTFRDNWVWDNHRYGMMLFTVPAPLREENDPDKALDTSHGNRFLGNIMGIDPSTGADAHNGLDFWWDEGGRGNCWADNHAPGLLGVLSDPPVLPECNDLNDAVQRPPSPKLATLVPCAFFDKRTNPHPVGCTWMETPDEPMERP